MWKLRKAWPQEQVYTMLSWKVSPPQDGPHWKLHSWAHVRRKSLWKAFIRQPHPYLQMDPGCYSRVQRVGLLCLLQEDEP